MQNEIHKQAVKFRREKLIELKRKIANGTATQFEIDMIKFWKGKFGDKTFT